MAKEIKLTPAESDAFEIYKQGALKMDEKGRYFYMVSTNVRRNGQKIVPSSLIKKFDEILKTES